MQHRRSHRLPLLGAAGAGVAIACCAGLPALAGVLGGVGVAALLGVGGGIVLLGAAAGAIVLWRLRRRRACRIDPDAAGGMS